MSSSGISGSHEKCHRDCPDPQEPSDWARWPGPVTGEREKKRAAGTKPNMDHNSELETNKCFRDILEPLGGLLGVVSLSVKSRRSHITRSQKGT